MSGLLRYLAVAAGALVLAGNALAGSLTLHPAGFGQKSYAAWKAHEGQPDSQGNAAQALYFQKNVPTPTFAAGVAVVRGLEGQPVSALNGLSWEHRNDGHCGAGAPRWNVAVQDALGNNSNVFLGCAAALHTPGSAPGWTRDSFDTAAISTAIGSAVTIRGLAIVFDEGNEPPTQMCSLDDPTNSCVRLDNIIVNDHCWTGASDNGANAPTAAQCTPAAFGGTFLLAPAALPVDDGLLTVLGATFPEVASADWVFYPTVL